MKFKCSYCEININFSDKANGKFKLDGAKFGRHRVSGPFYLLESSLIFHLSIFVSAFLLASYVAIQLSHYLYLFCYGGNFILLFFDSLLLTVTDLIPLMHV